MKSVRTSQCSDATYFALSRIAFRAGWIRHVGKLWWERDIRRGFCTPMTTFVLQRTRATAYIYLPTAADDKRVGSSGSRLCDGADAQEWH